MLFRSRKNYEIRGHAKNMDWKRATQLRLRQSLFQSQRMSPDFYFFQASFRSRLNHPHLRAEALSKRCSAVFYVHSTGSPHSQMQDFERGVNGDLYRQNRIFSQPGNFLSLPAARKLRLAKDVPLSPSPRNRGFAGGAFRLDQTQKTSERLFEKIFSTGVRVSEATAEWGYKNLKSWDMRWDRQRDCPKQS